jgi:hypothetical protein
MGVLEEALAAAEQGGMLALTSLWQATPVAQGLQVLREMQAQLELPEQRQPPFLLLFPAG